jgi:hypothetical protein
VLFRETCVWRLFLGFAPTAELRFTRRGR